MRFKSGMSFVVVWTAGWSVDQFRPAFLRGTRGSTNAFFFPLHGMVSQFLLLDFPNEPILLIGQGNHLTGPTRSYHVVVVCGVVLLGAVRRGFESSWCRVF
jgi:hypothetical protein